MAYEVDILLKDVPEELAKYLNDTGFAELCQRGKYKRFSQFQKIAFDILDNSKKNVPEEVIQKIVFCRSVIIFNHYRTLHHWISYRNPYISMIHER